MSKFEIMLIVLACLAPFFSILFILPKHLKKRAKEKIVVKEEKKEEPKIEEKEEPSVEVKPAYKPLVDNSISTDEFKSYLTRREKDISKPKKVDLPDDFFDRTTDYVPRERRKRKEEKPKTVAEEIKSLSPELKALIISGFLNRKY